MTLDPNGTARRECAPVMAELISSFRDWSEGPRNQSLGSIRPRVMYGRGHRSTRKASWGGNSGNILSWIFDYGGRSIISMSLSACWSLMLQPAYLSTCVHTKQTAAQRPRIESRFGPVIAFLTACS